MLSRLSPEIVLLGALLLIGCGSSSTSGGGSSTATAVPPNGTYLSAVAGAAYVQTFTFPYSATTDTLTAPSGTPAGLTFTPAPVGTNTLSAQLTGTPTTAGTGAFEIQVTDGNNKTQTVTYGFTVVNSAAPLALAPTTLPNGIQHVMYSQPLTVSNGIAPFTYTIQTGTLPPGLTLSSSTSASSAITGTPTAAGVYPFTIQITDSSSPAKVGNFSFSITVN